MSPPSSSPTILQQIFTKVIHLSLSTTTTESMTTNMIDKLLTMHACMYVKLPKEELCTVDGLLNNRPLSRCLDRCEIQSEAKDAFGGIVYYYVTMQITFFTRKFRNVQRNLHCAL